MTTAQEATDRIATLAQVLLAQQAEVERLEGLLTVAKADVRRTAEEDLPELMRECGLDLARLADGTKVEVRDEVDCAITELNRPAAHAWLEAHGYGGLIKTLVVVSYGREERGAAVELAEELGGRGVESSVEERVHPSTLKSFVKERMAAGEDVPADLFSLRPYSKVKLTAPKARKA